MSPIRTPSRKSATFTIAVASSALALAAVAAGTAAASTATGTAGAATAQPATARAATARPATAAGKPAQPLAPAPAAPVAGSAQSYQQVQLASTRTAAVVRGATNSHKAQHRRLTPRQIARAMLGAFDWSQRQFKYLNWLWERESGWNVYASNPYSGAYGIPQAVPGSKMASAGSHWRTSARTQIRWGLSYIRAVYGSPRRAWDHELATGWY